MNKNVVLIVFLFFNVLLNAQRNSGPTEENIAQAISLKESFEDEDLVILSKSVEIRFDKNNKTQLIEATVKEDIHFMNIGAVSRIQHPLFYDAESEVLQYYLSNRRGKRISNWNVDIKDEYLSSDDLFHTDYRVRYATINFPLQGSNSIITTEKKYRDIKYFTNQYFSDEYRILKGKVTIHIPEWLKLSIEEFNLQESTITKTSTKEGTDTIITYTIKEMAPETNEPQSPGPSHIYPHILFIAKAVKEKDGEEKTLFNDVSDLYSWYNSLVQKVEVDASVYQSKVEELIQGITSDEEKIKRIYYWVQDNIRYVAFEDGIAGFQPDSPQNVFTKRYGDCKGMAFLTKSMLEAAGLDARLVWIGTDRLAYDYSIPSLSVDNHMICAVHIDNQFVFLDGTEKYNRFGEYASRIQSKEALVQDKEGYKILTVSNELGSINEDRTTYKLFLEDNTLNGSVERSYSGECRVSFQNIYASFGKGDQEDVLKRYLTSGNSNYKVNDLQSFNSEDRDQDVIIPYMTSIENAVSEFDGTLYIDIDPVKTVKNLIFGERKSDFQFDILQKKITEIVLEIPAGYTVETLPENVDIETDLISLKAHYENAGGIIIYKKEIRYKQKRIYQKDFASWDATLEDFKDGLNQQVILKKS